MAIDNSQNTPFLLVELLESFSNKEIIGLRQIINCDYFNKDQLIIKLLKVLTKKVIHKNKSNLQIQCILYKQVFNKALKNEALTKKQKSLLSAKMSKLTKLVKRFLMMEELENSKINKSDLILNVLLKKKQFRLFEKQLKEECKTLNGNEEKNYYDHLVKLDEIKLNYLYQNGNWIKEDNLVELMKHLDIAYLIKKLDNTITALSFSKHKPFIEYDLSILKLLKSEYFIQYQVENNPSINIKVAVLNLMNDKTQEAYEKLLISLKKYESEISKFNLRGFYSVALNFCTNQTKRGFLEYERNHIFLYKILDKENLIAIDNTTLINDLRNIVTIGCRLKQFEWIEQIIKKYIPIANQTLRSSINNFHLSYVAFYKGAYAQSIDYLSKVDKFDFQYDLQRRLMLINSYFELDQHYLHQVAQLFRSFEAFVTKHKKMNDKDKTGLKNFIRIALNLYRLKHKVGIIKIETLKKIVYDATYIFGSTTKLVKHYVFLDIIQGHRERIKRHF